ANDVPLDELGAFARAVFGMLQRALPFEHGPARKIVLRHLREDRAEVDLPVAQRAEAPRALDPAAIAAIDTLPPIRTKLGVLHVKGLDALVIDIDEREVVELLQDVVTRIEQYVCAPVVLHGREKTFERHTVVQIF